ncbi:hypothetical protein [Methanolobus bombayensis]|uniref:hypothetical protein n=1 Tax=Methanolobus bombayensis TaxID=38023 RepID=UPI001AE2F9DD|nr:hypothetical protein [Methanolobus bombayensis]MBP1908599.1 hypothetical protein [Methanolobus bombayensis]
MKKPSSFDELLQALQDENIKDMSLLRDGLSIMILHYLAGVTKEIEWDVNLDQFYRILSEEVGKLGELTSSSIEIQKIFKPVRDRLNITEIKFDDLLVKCYGKDWVRLEVGTSIFDKDTKLVISGNNKYRYIKLLKKL